MNKLTELFSKPIDRPKNIIDLIKEKPNYPINFSEHLNTKLEWEKTFHNSNMWKYCVPISIYGEYELYACWDNGKDLNGVSICRNKIVNKIKKKPIEEELFDTLFELDTKQRERFFGKINKYLKFGYKFEEDTPKVINQ